MGTGAEVDSSLPPLPPGATLSSPTPAAGGGLPPLPTGAKMLTGDSSAAPAAASTPDLAKSTNPQGEGAYSMLSPDGRNVQVPYSKIQTMAPQGYHFANHGELTRYTRDYSADAVNEGMVDKFLDTLPWYDPVKMQYNAMLGVGTGASKTLAGADRLVRGNGALTRPEEQLQQAAETPTKGGAQAVGELGENVGEFFTGEELLGLVGKALPFAERLKAASGLAQVLDKHPIVAKLLKIGATAVKNGTMAGGQTLVKTGGDVGAAAGAAGLGVGGSVAADVAGAAGAAIRTARAGVPAETAQMLERSAGGVSIPVSEEAANATATPTATRSAEAYANLSREAIRANTEAVADSPRQVEAALNGVHDLTGAVARQQDILKPIYDNLNEVTEGKFRTLNAQVQQAKSLARGGAADAVAAYKNKLQEMDALLDNVPSVAGRKEYLQQVKDAWRQNMVLDDFAGNWDRNMNGTPGATNVSNEQRGMNGNGLMKDIQKTIDTHGRETVENAVGKERLQEWENIARWNQTNAKRKAFNYAVQEVASNVPKQGMTEFGKRATAMVVGGIAGHMLGASPYMGALGGEATYEGTRAVLSAIKGNPKIAQNFMFALESGATAQKYGPFIASMIQNAMSRASDDEQARQADQDAGAQPHD